VNYGRGRRHGQAPCLGEGGVGSPPGVATSAFRPRPDARSKFRVFRSPDDARSKFRVFRSPDDAHPEFRVSRSRLSGRNGKSAGVEHPHGDGGRPRGLSSRACAHAGPYAATKDHDRYAGEYCWRFKQDRRELMLQSPCHGPGQKIRIFCPEHRALTILRIGVSSGPSA